MLSAPNPTLKKHPKPIKSNKSNKNNTKTHYYQPLFRDCECSRHQIRPSKNTPNPSKATKATKTTPKHTTTNPCFVIANALGTKSDPQKTPQTHQKQQKQQKQHQNTLLPTLVS